MKNDLIVLKDKSSDPKIWDKPEAKTIFKEIKILEDKINSFHNLEKSIQSIEEFYILLKDKYDENLINELIDESKKVLIDSAL